ncbi:MAG: pirin family protein [Melioribacteraceae bacterium]|nr:pirin family protein [Melioribacteraceae bacterium]MCO6474418.1 pirin family protein [Melioribacteraceae bacterium]
MKKVIHRSNERGYFDHGWLKTNHSFSFASYYNPAKMHFGVLRVMNDDIIQAGAGFGTHPHENMEIISIPIYGSLAHKDSAGNEEKISGSEVQVMSAGTGIFHSEYNGSDTEDANFLQLWIFPDKKGHKPRYDQRSFDTTMRKNNFQLVVAPKDFNKEALWINQNAYVSLIDLDNSKEINYELYDKNNGVYVFIIEGTLGIGVEILNRRDAIGISNSGSIKIEAKDDAEILLIEVPMN